MKSIAVAVMVAALLPVAAQQAFATSIAQASSCAQAESPVAGEGGIEHQDQQNTGNQFGVGLAIQPFILSSTEPDDVTVSLNLCNVDDGSTVPHVTYEIIISKLSEAHDRVVMQERFHSHAEPLVLQSYEGEGAVAVEGAQHDSLTGGWLAGNETRVKNLIASSGIYNITIRILGAQDDGDFFPPDRIPEFQYTAFVSESFPQQVQDSQNASATYSIDLLSFHDRPYNFSLNREEGIISWSIPFNWSQFAALDDKGGMGSVSQAIVLTDPVFDLSSMERDSFLLTVNGHQLDGRYNIRAYDADSSVTKSPTLVVTVARNDTAAIAEKLAAEGELPESMDFAIQTSSVRIMPEFGPVAVVVAVATMLAVVAARRGLYRL